MEGYVCNPQGTLKELFFLKAHTSKRVQGLFKKVKIIGSTSWEPSLSGENTVEGCICSRTTEEPLKHPERVPEEFF